MLRGHVNFVIFHVNFASVDTVDNDDDEGSFEFSPKTEFTSILQQTLKQNHRISHNCHSVKSMSKLLAFKWLLNHLLLETECSEVMLIL